MFDINILIAIGVTAILVVLIRFVFPLYTDDLYRDVKNGLLLFGYAFRDDKLKEIADMLKISVNTSKSQLMKAKRMLQTKLDEYIKP